MLKHAHTLQFRDKFPDKRFSFFWKKLNFSFFFVCFKICKVYNTHTHMWSLPFLWSTKHWLAKTNTWDSDENEIQHNPYSYQTISSLTLKILVFCDPKLNININIIVIWFPFSSKSSLRHYKYILMSNKQHTLPIVVAIWLVFTLVLM